MNVRPGDCQIAPSLRSQSKFCTLLLFTSITEAIKYHPLFFRVNKWESGVIDEELKNGAICWLRNLDRKKWSLEIPYEVNGVTTSMFPDLVVVRADTEGYVFDILEPHDPSRKDNYPKAVGLAKFAEKHWDKFGRIQLIRLKKGVDGRDHFYRLDMGKTTVRNKVRGIISNEELDRIFDTDAERED